ncbi:MAG: division/cell wall cluster transcriptional repressor MraZ [Myxococcota bacterium]|nr:division/cell wall cluster transcriptional repressor MraZ [Myxococcota bacterium]
MGPRMYDLVTRGNHQSELISAARRMFTGEYTHTMDEKGRISVPADMRDVLRRKYEERLVLTKSLHGKCLWGFPEPEWEKLAEAIAASGLAKRQLHSLKRFLFPAARTCALDRAGRILVPGALRTFAAISDAATFVSVGKYLEIWQPDNWLSVSEELAGDDSVDAVLDAMAEIGL